MKKIISYTSYLFSILLVIFWGCSKRISETYTLEDFYTVQKIDAHVHLCNTEPELTEQAIKYNFRILTINTPSPDLGSIEKQQCIAVEQKKVFPKNVSFVATFSMEGWDEPDWQEKTVKKLQESIKKGAIGVKVWENMGLIKKDKDGRFILLDDPKFDPIFNLLVKNGIPLVGHIGASKHHWIPNKDSKSEGKVEYINDTYPGCPSFYKIIESRNNVLKKHPKLKLIGCHLASQGHCLDELAENLDAHPNLAVDVSGRMKRFHFHSQKDGEKVRDFIIKYQNRILYGTDLILDATKNNSNSIKVKLEMMHEKWINDWKYFTTDQVMTSPRLQGEFTGLALPKSVVKKIYRINAEKWFQGI